MSKKYRIKLISNRVIGPVHLNQIIEIYQKGHLTGEEKVQVFPGGDWKRMSAFPEIENEILKSINNEENFESLDPDKTVVRIASAKTRRAKEKSKENEEIEKKIEEIQKIEDQVKEEEFKEFQFKRENTSDQEDLARAKDINPDELEKTKVFRRNDPAEIEKTRIITPQNIKEELQGETHENDNEETETIREKQDEESFSNTDQTKIFDPKDLMPAARDEVEEVEKELIKIEEENLVDEENHQEYDEEELEEEEEEKGKRKKTTPIVALAIIVVFYFLLFDDEEAEKKAISPVFATISTPVVFEVPEPQKAKKLFSEGFKLFKVEQYKKLILASNKFKLSLENQYENNKALGFLLLSYAKLYPNIRDKEKAAQVLFRLVKIARAKTVKDVNVAMGTALFYKHTNKIQTALLVLENFLKVTPKPTIDFYSLYLELLIEGGNLIKASKILKVVEDYSGKSASAFLAISHFYELDEKYKSSKKTILNGLAKFPTNIPLLLSMASHFLRDQDFKNYAKNLRIVEQLKAEESPTYYAKFLEYMGILSVYNKDNKKAVFLFRLALKINPTDTLISKLAALEIGGNTLVESLILESKAKDLIRRSKKLSKQQKWEEAFKAALEASDLNQNYIPAQTNLASLQVKRGYFQYAIKKLEDIRKEYPNNATVLFDLVDAFIAAKKKSEAQGLVSAISNSKLKNNVRYNSMLGKFYFSVGRYDRAIHFYNRSTARSPLNDEDYFVKAQIYMLSRQYSRARIELSEAINLDPLNIEYHSLFAKILSELDGVSVAIGYLQNLLKKNKDNPKILGDIAIFYYKEGKINEFESFKKQISSLRAESSDFYKFLIESAVLEEKIAEIIKYSKKLLDLEPGNVEIRMLLGQSLMNQGKYRLALGSFEEVLKRLESYPTANYFRAKVYIKMKRYKDALVAGEKEIKNNPTIYHGYYITGETQRIIGLYQEALKNLETAVSKDARSVESLMALGWIKWRQNYLDLALEYYKRAKKQDQANPEIRKQLGNIYASIGQGALALEEFDVYLKLYPNAPDRTRIQQRINQLRR